MATYQKSKDANRYRKRMIEILRKYEVEARKNSGQLKFLNTNLFFPIIAVSTRARKQKTSFETYFVEQVIPKANNGNDGNERVLAFFEQKKNMQAFLKSPYMNSKVEENERFLSNPKMELRYLLMENLQALIEKNLLAYLTIKPAQACDDSDEQNENMQNTDKVEAYVFLLYSMAYYGIFLREQMKEYLHKMAEDSNHALQRINNIQNPIEALQKNYEENLPMLVEYQCYHKYIIRQCTIWNSYFNLILMIEGYNILYFREKINKTDDDFLAYLENTTIRYLMEPIEESDEYKYYFFCENMNASKNMTKLYKSILSEVEYGKLLPLDKKNEVDPCNVFLKAVKTYVNYIAENPKEQRTNEQEKILWEIMEKMGFDDDRCPC